MEPSYTQIYKRFSMIYRRQIDKYIMLKKQRWIFTFLLIILYIIRIVQVESYIVVTYLLVVFEMQLLIKFSTPLGLPDIDDDDDDVDIQLPSHSDDRPLLRSMSEISYWESATIAPLFAIVATFFQIFDLPVFWPFLVGYLILVIILTFSKYLKHMSKYGYSWADFRKR